MKILIANSGFGGGGITTYAHELIDALWLQNDLSIMLRDDKIAPIDKSKANVIYQDCQLLSLDNALQVINIINNQIHPDLLIASGATLIPIVAPFLSDDIRIVTVSHSNKYTVSDYSAFNHQYIDRIIAASSIYNKKYLERKFSIKEKDKIQVIENFVADNENVQSLIKEKEETQQVSIVFVGAGNSPKSPEIALAVLKKLIKTNWNFKFYWTGKTTIPLTKFYAFRGIKEVRQLVPDDDRVVFTGRIADKRDLDKLVAGCTIFLAPSRREGCSMALIEAIRDGSISIVADYKNSNRILVKDGYNGFVISRYNISEFVKRIGDIINNYSMYLEFPSNAREVYLDRFTFKVWAQNIRNKVLCCETKHQQRMNNVDVSRIKVDIRNFSRLEKRNKIMSFFEESLPTYLYMIIQRRYH